MDKFCTSCGSKIEPGQEKCLYCGKVLRRKSIFSSRIDTEEDMNNNTNTNDNYNEKNNYNQAATTLSSDSSMRFLGIFLAFFFGVFGIHNFVYGYTTKGTIQLLMTICSFGILAPIVMIWAFIEGLLMVNGTIKPKNNYTSTRH